MYEMASLSESTVCVCVIVSVCLSPSAPFLRPPTILRPLGHACSWPPCGPRPTKDYVFSSFLLIPSIAFRLVGQNWQCPLRSSPYVSENPERGENQLELHNRSVEELR